MSLLDECIGLVTSVQISPGCSTHEFDLNFLYEKLDTVYGKHSRNSGER